MASNRYRFALKFTVTNFCRRPEPSIWQVNLRGHLTDIVEKDEQIDAEELIQDINSILMYTRNGMHVFDMIHNEGTEALSSNRIVT